MTAYENSFAYQLLQKFETMRERIQNYIAVVDLCPLPAFITSREGNVILYVNNAYRRFIGSSEEKLQNEDWLNIIHPDDREATRENWASLIRNPVNNIAVSHRHRYITANGMSIQCMTYATPVVNNGIVGYIVPCECSGLLYIGVNMECPLQKEKLAAKAGDDPATFRVTAGCSTS